MQQRSMRRQYVQLLPQNQSPCKKEMQTAPKAQIKPKRTSELFFIAENAASFFATHLTPEARHSAMQQSLPKPC